MTRCAHCGRDPVTGFSMLAGAPYCLDDETGPTCFERNTWRELPTDSHLRRTRCVGFEPAENPCACACEGCDHHCSACHHCEPPGTAVEAQGRVRAALSPLDELIRLSEELGLYDDP